ncbi:MAG TPA: hypothetical protein ENI62_14650 [Gammaproteobacteria bacterium]|nr:hypothetical protein [Gammaproteobacteria bacterium]
MQITNATVQLSSTHSLQRSQQLRQTLDVQLGQQRLHQESENGQLTLSKSSQLRSQLTASQIEKTNNPAVASDEISAEDALPPDLKLIKLMLEYITQRVIKLATNPTLTDPKDATGQAPQAPPRNSQSVNNPTGFGLRFRVDTTTTEQESARFDASGIIRTSDGKEIRFHLGLTLNRSFTRQQHQQISMGTLRDPLVINLNVPSAILDQQQFSFDLNVDGKLERLHTLQPGSGFLALDRNQDGVINNGSELFGATSGDGFKDLARLDSDHNGWIDGNDPLFSSLRIWSPRAGETQNSDALSSLQAAGVGAIYLGKAATPMQLQGNNGSRYGQLRNTGLYVTQEGTVGTVQQLDLVT